jgi:hypothetical protein
MLGFLKPGMHNFYSIYLNLSSINKKGLDLSSPFLFMDEIHPFNPTVKPERGSD